MKKCELKENRSVKDILKSVVVIGLGILFAVVIAQLVGCGDEETEVVFPTVEVEVNVELEPFHNGFTNIDIITDPRADAGVVDSGEETQQDASTEDDASTDTDTGSSDGGVIVEEDSGTVAEEPFPKTCRELCRESSETCASSCCADNQECQSECRTDRRSCFRACRELYKLSKDSD